MELTLKVYTNSKLKEVEKEYKCDDFRLSLGVVEDLMNYINIDGFTSGGLEALSDESQLSEVVSMIYGAYGTFKDLIKDVYDGITDDELRRTSVEDIALNIIQIVKYSLSRLGSTFGYNAKRKN